jgi:hypothetical protein
MNCRNAQTMSDITKALTRLGPYWTHGKTLRRLGVGEDTRTEEHKMRGLMMRGAFNGHHAHTHGRRWPQNGPGDMTPVVRTGPPPRRKGVICQSRFTYPNPHKECSKKSCK